ncbi:protein kinase [Phytomonospora sp. NPDC050363]|uniref:protein kinase domain-containing protein n=1 Tax=Phytomonospora sp. NPDC050363 TaxID=3155642 RepID=UPI0034045699
MHEDELVGARYRLDARIATGGTGEVWRALDTRLDRIVAVKLLHPEMSASEEFRARFESEARTLAGLDAPSVASVSDHGVDESAHGVRCYLVMELVDGRSLAAALGEDGTLPPGETARIVADAAEGLQIAHDAGIVHGGVKPADVLITSDGEVKLIDFGAARAVEPARPADPAAVAYTAPERFSDTDPTPAADIYALGAVAFECLTGAPPFASTDPQAVIAGHLNQPPPALPEDVPGVLAEAVYKALRKETADRWLTAHSFGAACRTGATERPSPAATVLMPAAEASSPETTVEAEATTALETPRTLDPVARDEGTKVEAAPGSPADEAASPRRRRRVLIAVLAVAAVLIALAAAFALPALTGGESETAGPEQSAGAASGPASSPETAPSEEDDAPGDAPGSADDRPGAPDTTGPDQVPESSGQAPLVAVPDLVGLPMSQAPELLAAEGFENHQPEAARPDGLAAVCEIWEQTPAAGTRVAAGTTIVYRYMPALLGDCATRG